MPSLISIEPTEFVNVRSGQKTFGFRIYDDYSQLYDNTWEDIPSDDLDVLERVVNSDSSEIKTMIDFVKEHETRIEIGGNYYEFDEIKDIL